MKGLDTTQLGVYISVISFVVGLFKLNVYTEEVTQAVTAIGTLVGLGIVWYKRYSAGDLTLGGFSKDKRNYE